MMVKMPGDWFGLTECLYARGVVRLLTFGSKIYPDDGRPKKWPELTRLNFKNLRRLHVLYA